MARIREILAESDRLNAERIAREEAARKKAAEPHFEFDRYQPEDWPTAPPAPQKRISSHGIPLPASQMRIGEPQGTAGPPPEDASIWLVTGGMIVAALLALAGLKWGETRGVGAPSLKAAINSIGTWRRRNADLLIVAGIAIVAAAFTILKPTNLPAEYRDYVSDGWLAFGGVAIALIGFYDKMRAASPPKI